LHASQNIKINLPIELAQAPTAMEIYIPGKTKKNKSKQPLPIQQRITCASTQAQIQAVSDLEKQHTDSRKPSTKSFQH
jgi:hypothetical protein